MPEADSLAFFDHAQAKMADAAVTLSRTGYTGDLGFEVTVEADHAVDVLDAVLEAGHGHGIRPFGEEALMMLRIEAGLPLVDVEWHNSRLAFTDDQRVTPKELGMGWMLRGVRDGDAPSSAAAAIRRELVDGTSRWASVGIVVDWPTGTGCTATPGCSRPRTSTRCPTSRCCYDDDRRRRRSATSPASCTPPCCSGTSASPGSAPTWRQPAPRCTSSSRSHHHNTTVLVTTTTMPLFNPARKTDEQEGMSSHDYDAIVVGGGHNGLINAGYLPRPGCARWCSSSATWSAAPRSPRSWCPASRSRRSPTR